MVTAALEQKSRVPKSRDLTLEETVLRFGHIELGQPLSRAEFGQLADRYPDLKMERETNGTTLIMSPIKRKAGITEPKLYGFLFAWQLKTGLGELHGPSSGFDLPDGSTKQPDAAWISDQILALHPAPEDGDDFVKIVPDFVAEIRSSTDRLKKLQAKMSDSWMANGVQLGWLIDPWAECAHIYRQGRPVEIIEGFAGKKLTGEDVLPGFELPLEAFRQQK